MLRMLWSQDSIQRFNSRGVLNGYMTLAKAFSSQIILNKRQFNLLYKKTTIHILWTHEKRTIMAVGKLDRKRGRRDQEKECLTVWQEANEYRI